MVREAAYLWRRWRLGGRGAAPRCSTAVPLLRMRLFVIRFRLNDALLGHIQGIWSLGCG